MFTAVIIFLLLAFTGTLVGRDYFRELNAAQDERIHDALNDGLTPFDPRWEITEGQWPW